MYSFNIRLSNSILSLLYHGKKSYIFMEYAFCALLVSRNSSIIFPACLVSLSLLFPNVSDNILLSIL